MLKDHGTNVCQFGSDINADKVKKKLDSGQVSGKPSSFVHKTAARMVAIQKPFME